MLLPIISQPSNLHKKSCFLYLLGILLSKHANINMISNPIDIEILKDVLINFHTHIHFMAKKKG